MKQCCQQKNKQTNKKAQYQRGGITKDLINWKISHDELMI